MRVYIHTLLLGFEFALGTAPCRALLQRSWARDHDFMTCRLCRGDGPIRVVVQGSMLEDSRT